MQSVVHHFGMTVDNIEETQEFYSRHFGFTATGEPFLITDDWFAAGVAHEGAQVRIGWLHRDGVALELHEYVVPATRHRLAPDITHISAPHIAFKVDDIDEIYQRLSADGVRFYAPPVEVSAEGSAPQLAGVKWCYCEDPNGYIVEIFYEPASAGIDWDNI